jgi:AbrB family looped-hinge helix DNA binding protein
MEKLLKYLNIFVSRLKRVVRRTPLSTYGWEIIIAISRVHSNGRVQVPKEVRVRLNLEDGDKVAFIEGEDGRIYIDKLIPRKAAKLGGT